MFNMEDNLFSNPSLWSDNALNLAHKRYLFDTGLRINEWFEKVAQHICRNYSNGDKEHFQKLYTALLKSKAFLPTSAALANSLKEKGAFAGCIVLPLPSSIEEIFDSALAKIMRMLLLGIGVGLDLSHLAPRLFLSDGRASLGPVQSLLSIAQAVERPALYAGLKRAAFMATLFAQHPDIFEFIALKKHQNLANVNISVSVDAAFNRAIEQGALLPIMWRDEFSTRLLTTEHLIEMKRCADRRSVDAPDLEIRGNQVFSKSVHEVVGRVLDKILYLDAERLLQFIADSAHSCGDPGLINLDAINLANPTHPSHSRENRLGVGIIKTTTPCGEQPLLPYEVCHLGSFNLSAFIKNQQFQEERFSQTIHLALRFMDDLISVGDNGLNEANELSLANRKIGLGVMGFADALAELEIPYDSPEALTFAHHVGNILKSSARKASELLAQERGSYLNFPFSKYQEEIPRRHATLTTIAPTGHIATLADCSFGIEPYYLIEFQRNAAGNKIHRCSVLENKLKTLGYSLKQWISDTRDNNPMYHFEGSIAELLDEPFSDIDKNRYVQKLKGVFKTSHEISYKDHLNMIMVWQKYIDNGISKTINLPKSASPHDVLDIFRTALKFNLKGITIFRDDSLLHQALSKPLTCVECPDSRGRL
jgi:ribonucleoside-diphosphate reductase alpha chain